MTDTPRLLELRRRVQADPASTAFAPLAEECRRAGAHDEAVGLCRAGLRHHPDCHSARVTLGRALFQLGRLDEAEAELSFVLEHAAASPEAHRALGEVLERQGRLPEALARYRRALELASVGPPPAVTSSKVAVEELFDFDTLLSQLGRTEPTMDSPSPPPVTPAPSVLDRVRLDEDDADPFSVLERKLRENSEEEARHQRFVAELEEWLAAITVARGQRHGV